MRFTLFVKRRPAVAASFFAAVALATVPLSNLLPSETARGTVAPQVGSTVAHVVPDLPPEWPLSLAAHADRTVEGEFRPGTTFARVLGQAGVPSGLVHEVGRAIAEDFDVRRIRAGRPYKVYFDDADELLMFRYQPEKQRAVVVARSGEGWVAKDIVVPFDIRPRFLHANIRGSLEGALSSTWLKQRDAIDLARKLADIFAWDIDFAADLRVNDSLDVMVEQRFLEGEFVGFGDVLAAELRVGGRAYQAVRYARPGGSVTYFTPRGESLQRAFLRSPVNYSRISSRFSYRRMHPVLNVVRPHYGVDYVAPAGTPVHATASGTVTYASRNSQAGNHVKIRHGGSYTSWYLHLRGFAAGLSVGDKVEQGQVIGYVGSTGLVTSTHLDYRLERAGEFVDPLKIDFPAAAPLPVEHMSVFGSQRDRWMSLLRQGQTARPAVPAGSGE